MSAVSETKSADSDKVPSRRGICDDPSQFAKHFVSFSGHVWFCPIYRLEQVMSGGWRWEDDNKWGPYHGQHELKSMEYLIEADGYDKNPRIDVQYLYQLATSSDGDDDDAPFLVGHRPFAKLAIREGVVETKNWIESWQPCKAISEHKDRMSYVASIFMGIGKTPTPESCQVMFMLLWKGKAF